jgi:hypothetical protein
MLRQIGKVLDDYVNFVRKGNQVFTNKIKFELKKYDLDFIPDVLQDKFKKKIISKMFDVLTKF